MSKVKNFGDVAFTDSVKEVQEEMGSRQVYERIEGTKMNTELEARELPFIMNRDSFYLASSNKEGRAYVQFRGGPKGFLKILDSQTLGFLDYSGNRQYISTGNINENKEVCLFLMDYPNKARLKIWAEAETLSVDELKEKGLYDKLLDPDYKVKIERGFIFKVQAFDWNCPKHIPQRYTIEEIGSLIGHNDLSSIDDLRALIGK